MKRRIGVINMNNCIRREYYIKLSLAYPTPTNEEINYSELDYNSQDQKYKHVMNQN